VRHRIVAEGIATAFRNASHDLETITVIVRKLVYTPKERFPMAYHFRVLDTGRVELITNMSREQKELVRFLGGGMDRKVPG
jgi:hypothetical protein